MRITIDPAAWKEGFRAGEASKPVARCPYPAAASIESYSWHSGYIEGVAAKSNVKSAAEAAEWLDREARRLYPDSTYAREGEPEP